MSEAIAQTLLSSGAATGQWVLSAEATTIQIAHKTLWGLATVKGTFRAAQGEGTVSPDGSVTGRLTIDAASIDTKNKKRDEHLRSADFLNVAAYPEITLEVRSAAVTNDQELRLQAELTVAKVKEPMQILAHVSTATASTVTLRVESEVDRERFGIAWNRMGMIKGRTAVTINAVFNRPA